MDLTPVKVAVLILKHHGVPMCIAGELALNYYNVPRVCHDLEICVPRSSLLAAPGLLCSTGLFEPSELNDDDFNNYTEHKRGFPRLRTTNWTYPPQAVVIFPTAFFGLDPIEKATIPSSPGREFYVSKEVQELGREEVANLPLPRLAPLLRGLGRMFLDSGNDMAMVALEQLVDGMNIDEAWAAKHLQDADTALQGLVISQIRGKKSRIDYYSENKITCFVRDEKEAAGVRLIPGFE